MDTLLDSAIAELKAAASRESLSDGARTRIVAEAWRQQQDRPEAFEPSTRPARWVGWIGGIRLLPGASRAAPGER